MGYHISWDVASITQQIYKMRGEICSPYNDGYTTWPIKQDLYQLKWLIDQSLQDCPTFSGEEEWLKEQSKKQMWSELKR